MKEKHTIIKVLPKYNARRFSWHLFNTKAEVDHLVQELKSML
jgi:selenocysteine lyase/cysteine desulfurase